MGGGVRGFVLAKALEPSPMRHSAKRYDYIDETRLISKEVAEEVRPSQEKGKDLGTLLLFS